MPIPDIIGGSIHGQNRNCFYIVHIALISTEVMSGTELRIGLVRIVINWEKTFRFFERSLGYFSQECKIFGVCETWQRIGFIFVDIFVCIQVKRTYNTRSVDDSSDDKLLRLSGLFLLRIISKRTSSMRKLICLLHGESSLTRLLLTHVSIR